MVWIRSLVLGSIGANISLTYEMAISYPLMMHHGILTQSLLRVALARWELMNLLVSN